MNEIINYIGTLKDCNLKKSILQFLDRFDSSGELRVKTRKRPNIDKISKLGLVKKDKRKYITVYTVEQDILSLHKSLEKIEKSCGGKKRERKKVDYNSYINSKQWKRKREQALTCHGKKCDICGCEDNLQVHHLSYRNLGNELMTDLQVLCLWCHNIEHEDKYESKDKIYQDFKKKVVSADL